jgi:multidrug efflux pump subunit AcrA (membrane-fusion protein)
MISEKSRVQAVAAKISAARELARRLAEEKQAAVAAAKADADSDRMKRSTEEAAAQAAAQVRKRGFDLCYLLVCCWLSVQPGQVPARAGVAFVA